MSSFWIWHILYKLRVFSLKNATHRLDPDLWPLQAAKRSKGRLILQPLALASFPIQVGSANRAETAAIRLADDLHGQRENHLLPHQIRQLNSLPRIECNIQFISGDFNFLLARNA